MVMVMTMLVAEWRITKPISTVLSLVMRMVIAVMVMIAVMVVIAAMVVSAVMAVMVVMGILLLSKLFCSFLSFPPSFLHSLHFPW